MQSSKDESFDENIDAELKNKNGSERISKKITLEIDIEKILKYIFFFLVFILMMIYGYKGIMSAYDYFNRHSEPSYKIAVLDMQELRREYSINKGINSKDIEGRMFENYFKTLMSHYRERGYLVIDANLAITVPDSVEIVTFVDLDSKQERYN